MPNYDAPPTPDDIRDYIKRHNMTQRGFANLLKVEPRTVERWLAGSRTPETYLWAAMRYYESQLSPQSR